MTILASYSLTRQVWMPRHWFGSLKSFRDEHRQTLEWLNERTDTDTLLFAIVLEVLQIDDSAPAYNFKPVVFPNKWQKTTHGGNPPPSPRAQAYQQFFQSLIDELREIHKFTGSRVAIPQSWYSFSSGMTGISYSASFALGGRIRVELTMANSEAGENKSMFDWLSKRRQTIEAEFGHSMEWERLDEKKSSRIAIYRSGAIDNSEETLLDIRKWIVDNLLSFKKIFGPLIKEYARRES